MPKQDDEDYGAPDDKRAHPKKPISVGRFCFGAAR
jgi:hypothetical protein